MVVTLRDVYARSDCYAGYKSTGLIPQGTTLTLLPMAERRFDEFNRECVLVEFRGSDFAIIGYVLMADVTVQ